MTDYNNTFGGAAKDSGTSVILGAEFDTEFDAVATMSATKADKAVPAATNNVALLGATGNLVDSTVTQTELNILDGATVTTTELNYLDGVTSNVQTQLDAVFTTETSTTTSGASSYTFTGIPSSVTKIDIILDEVSYAAGGGTLAIRIGDSGGIESTGYEAGSSDEGSSNAFNSTTEFVISANGSNSAEASGIITLINISGNRWIMSGNIYEGSSTDSVSSSAGRKTLSGSLDRVQILNTGAINFDGGLWNIRYS